MGQQKENSKEDYRKDLENKTDMVKSKDTINNKIKDEIKDKECARVQIHDSGG